MPLIKTIIPFHYVGIHYAEKPNYYAKLIYAAKFLQNPKAKDRIVLLMLPYLPDDIDVIIPVWTTHSKSSLPKAIAKKLSVVLFCDIITDYWKHPQKYNLNYKNILIIDDIVTTGRTMNKAIEIVNKYNPFANIYFTAFASPLPQNISH